MIRHLVRYDSKNGTTAIANWRVVHRYSSIVYARDSLGGQSDSPAMGDRGQVLGYQVSMLGRGVGEGGRCGISFGDPLSLRARPFFRKSIC